MLETMAYITATVAPSHTVASSRLLRPLDDDGEDDDGNNGAGSSGRASFKLSAEPDKN